MSIQPSLSKSRKAQPAPVVSGKYFSGDLPFTCLQEMPLAEVGTCSNGNSAGGSALAIRGQAPTNADAASPVSKSRRVSRTALLMFGILGKEIRPEVLFFFPFTRRRVLRQLALHGKLSLCFFLLAGSAQGHGQIVMRRGIALLEADSHPQGWNCLFVSLHGDKTKSQAQVGFREIGIELCGHRKSGDSLVPFLISPGKFSQDVLGASILWVNLDFL